MKRQWTLLSVLAAASAVAWSQPPPQQTQSAGEPGQTRQQEHAAQRARNEGESKQHVEPTVQHGVHNVETGPGQTNETPRTIPENGPARRLGRQPVIKTPETTDAHPTPFVPPAMKQMQSGQTKEQTPDNENPRIIRGRQTPVEHVRTPAIHVTEPTKSNIETNATPAPIVTPNLHRRRDETPVIGKNATPTENESVPANAKETPFTPISTPGNHLKTNNGNESPGVTPNIRQGMKGREGTVIPTRTPQVIHMTPVIPTGSAKATPAGSPTPFVPTDMPEKLQRRGNQNSEGTKVSPTPKTELPTPKTMETPATGQHTPAAAIPTPAASAVRTPATFHPTPTPKAVSIDQVKLGGLNNATANLFGMSAAGAATTRNGNGKGKRNPQSPQLTPWVAPTNRPGSIIAPGGAPTPTPAPERIFLDAKDRNKFHDNLKHITLAPTPPPAPTPGATPVPTPPGVTPVPANFHPPHNWTPYPGWKPPHDWHPPTGWTPPGGWTPPPGWQPPAAWVPKLRKWGWNYIPHRGWVVDVRWTPPPDFIVPPNWYYLPTSSYDDYGLYDPSQVVVIPGAARPDLRIGINESQLYMPPPPPAIGEEALPPPPPRPLPPEPIQVPEQITEVSQVVDVLSRPRQPDESRYQGPVLVTGSIHFDTDKYAIEPVSFPTLDAIGKALTDDLPDAIINVEGHTDSDGSNEYNQTLSEQRAWSVKSYLVQKFGLDPNRLMIVGYGETAPIATNDTPDGKAENRRVEFENVTELYKSQVVDTGQANADDQNANPPPAPTQQY